MKSTATHPHRLYLIALLLTAGMFVQCTSQQGISTQKPDTLAEAYASRTNPGSEARNIENPSNRQLSDMLRTIPGVAISGSGGNTTVIIRGYTSITGENEPLFVLDGVPVGYGYRSIANSINVDEVESIRVLKGGQAALYGSRAANGVIQIKMKGN